VASYSHSKLTTFQQCQQKYKFRYVDEIPPPVRSIELHLGDSVHRALQKLYGDAIHGAIHSCEDLLIFYRQIWEEGYTPNMRIVRSGTTPRTYLERGRTMLEDYYKRFHPFQQSGTLELEEKFTFPVSEKDEIRGVVDRLARTADGSLEIHDYKTSRTLPSPAKVGADLQLALYELGLRHRRPDARAITLIWHYLAFDHEIQITKTSRQLEAIKSEVLGIIARIEATSSFPASVTPLCNWCEYKEMCPAMAGR